MNNDAEIIKCLFEQINLMQDLLEDKIMQEGARIVAEINMHKRDKHLEYWDHSYYLEYGNTQREKISDLHKKMRENKNKIVELIKVNDTQSKPPPTDDKTIEPQFLSELVTFGTLPQ